MGRIESSDDIARAAPFLVSDESEFITGTALVVDGGMTSYVSRASLRPLPGVAGAAAGEAAARPRAGYRVCGARRVGSPPGAIGARLVGLVSVVPWMLLDGSVRANVGRFLARICVAASNPAASRISVGSLNADPKKLIPSGAPNTIPAGICTIG